MMRYAASVMLERPGRGANELVLWIGTALLAASLAVGASFALWNQLQGTKEGAVLIAAIVTLGFGASLVGLAIQSRLARTFMLVFAITFVLGFFEGSPVLAHFVK
jgi:hypothetical protein